jgi:hypothetical protein
MAKLDRKTARGERKLVRQTDLAMIFLAVATLESHRAINGTPTTAKKMSRDFIAMLVGAWSPKPIVVIATIEKKAASS